MTREIRTAVRLWSMVDEILAERGVISPEDVRSIDLDSVLVDTGAVRLVINRDIVDRLGLSLRVEVMVKYADERIARKPIAQGIGLEIMGRRDIFSAVVEDRDEPLIGMVVLEELDLWPDPQRGVLTTNPLSPDVPLYNLL